MDDTTTARSGTEDAVGHTHQRERCLAFAAVGRPLLLIRITSPGGFGEQRQSQNSEECQDCQERSGLNAAVPIGTQPECLASRDETGTHRRESSTGSPSRSSGRRCRDRRVAGPPHVGANPTLQQDVRQRIKNLIYAESDLTKVRTTPSRRRCSSRPAICRNGSGRPRDAWPQRPHGHGSGVPTETARRFS